MSAFDDLFTIDPNDALSHVIEVDESKFETIRCYWPRTHFYPLLPKMYVPTELIHALWGFGDRPVASGGKWRYTFPDPLTDTSPWTLIGGSHKAMVGRTIRYIPGVGEDREYVYVVTDDILRRDGVGNDLQRIVWRD